MIDYPHQIAIVVAAAVVMSGCTPASAGQVSTTEGLLAALSKAKPGEKILLAPGRYEGVKIRNFNGTATVASEDPAHPAVLRDLIVDGSSGLVLQDLEMSTADMPVDSAGVGKMPFVVIHSHAIVLRRLNVHGSPDGTLATDISGVLVRLSDHVTVEDSEFSHLHNGLQHVDDDDIIFRNNHFHLLRDDGIRGGGSSNVLIENNRCDSNHPDKDDADHPDCIQFWTSNTTAPAHDITIRGNVYRRGSGHPVQGIFLRDETTKLPYENVVVTDNTIEGGLWNGIAVMGSHNPFIEGNRVCGYPDQESWLVLRDSDGGVVKNNRSEKLKYVNTFHYKDEHNGSARRCEIVPSPGKQD